MTAFGQLFCFGTEQNGVEHHAVADDIGFPALENTRWDGTQDIFFSAEFQCVTGIGTALKSSYDLVTRRQHVHDLSFALVPPLKAEYHVCFFHLSGSVFGCKRRFLHPKVSIIWEKPNTLTRFSPDCESVFFTVVERRRKRLYPIRY